MNTTIRAPIFVGFMAALILAGCGGGGGGGGSANPSTSPSVDTTTSPPVDTTTPTAPAVLVAADAESAYADVLVGCVLAETDSESCTLTTLPLLGQEKELILQALEECLWVQKNAAEKLGVSPRALNYKVKKFGITHPNWRKHR